MALPRILHREHPQRQHAGHTLRRRPCFSSGARWNRRFDRAGLAFASNGISRDHQQYLALGGLGFLLGDGRLNYGRENIVETYYTLHVWRGVYPSFGLQYVVHPGYNRDRGPVLVPSFRAHIEF